MRRSHTRPDEASNKLERALRSSRAGSNRRRCSNLDECTGEDLSIIHLNSDESLINVSGNGARDNS
jgi:hypothetical protein